MTGDPYDVAVIGGGPGGLSAAVTAAENGARVIVLDENPRLGGQIWREDLGQVAPAAKPWIERLRAAKVKVLGGVSVWQATPETLSTTVGTIRSHRTILATGARELFLPFPGWTLPGVVGAGGVQALAHSGLDVQGQRIVIAGSGPLLLQVASGLRRHGAKVQRIAEQAPFSKLLGFAPHLGFSKTVQAATLSNPTFRTSSWVVEAIGQDRLEAVRLKVGRRTEVFDCDLLAVGFGLVPNLELPLALGCEVSPDGVLVDDQQQTSVSSIFAVGEVCGVKGAPGALADGLCAGNAVTNLPPPSQQLRRRNTERRFGQRLAATYQIRDEIRAIPNASTTVCRCESVSFGALSEWSDWSAAKIHTRCGMGLCQGRVCGPAAKTLFGWGPTGTRPPLSPIPISDMLSTTKEPEP